MNALRPVDVSNCLKTGKNSGVSLARYIGLTGWKIGTSSVHKCVETIKSTAYPSSPHLKVLRSSYFFDICSNVGMPAVGTSTNSGLEVAYAIMLAIDVSNSVVLMDRTTITALVTALESSIITNAVYFVQGKGRV